jgi:acyl-CoA synthetase (AMP-forming)/AMP-acid ligase II/acyl carrier protein
MYWNSKKFGVFALFAETYSECYAPRTKEITLRAKVMAVFNTLVEALIAQASTDSSITYIKTYQDERTLTFRNLWVRALGILYLLRERGLSPGDKLVIFLNSNEQFLDGFWACLLGGIVPVPIAVGISDAHRQKLLNILKTLQIPNLYTDNKSLTRITAYAQGKNELAIISKVKGKTILVDEIHDISRQGAELDVAPDDIAFIQYSSGSTSEPKGVVLTHKNILTNIAAIIEAAKFTSDDTSLSWMPLTHDMGLIGFHLNMLVCGITHYLMPTDLFVRRPLLWVRKASEKKANVLCSPNFGYKHVLRGLNDEELRDIDLSHVRLIFNGAEPISPTLCNEFLDRLAPYGLKKTSMFTVYGLAEASLAVSFPQVGQPFKTVYVDRHALAVGQKVKFRRPDDADAIGFVSEGRPVRDCRVKIVDDAAVAVDENVVGHICISGNNVTRGYYLNETANAQAFDSRGWLNTGDLGFIKDDELIVTGRAKEIIFINGQNYYPHDLETIVQNVDQLDLGKVVVTGTRAENSDVENLLVFVLYKGELGGFVKLSMELTRTLNEKAGIEVTHVIPVKRIPKTTSGKVQRHLLEEQYRQGNFSQVLETLAQLQLPSELDGTVARNEIERKLKLICDTAIPDKAIGVCDNLFKIGTSSLALVQIHDGIEETFPGLLDITDLFNYPTIAQLASFLEEKLKEQAP